METLVESGCIKISVDSPLNSVVVEQDGSISYYIYQIYYELNVYCCDGEDDSLLERAIYPDPHEFLVNDKFCLNMWENIVYSEALEYLLFKMKSVGYDSFSPGEKTKIVLKKLLGHFSVAQVYNVIYKAISYSTEAYQSGRAQNKKHASNMVIASCESYGERAILSSWDLKPYSREKQLPQSQLSRTFFDAILQIGTDGFYKVPHIQCYEESL